MGKPKMLSPEVFEQLLRETIAMFWPSISSQAAIDLGDQSFIQTHLRKLMREGGPDAKVSARRLLALWRLYWRAVRAEEGGGSGYHRGA